MAIEELLNKLHAKKDELKKQYDKYYDEFKEVGEEIKDYYESPFVTPTDVPMNLITKASYLHDAYMGVYMQYNNIRTSIITIEDMLKES